MQFLLLKREGLFVDFIRYYVYTEIIICGGEYKCLFMYPCSKLLKNGGYPREKYIFDRSWAIPKDAENIQTND